MIDAGVRHQGDLPTWDLAQGAEYSIWARSSASTIPCLKKWMETQFEYYVRFSATIN